MTPTINVMAVLFLIAATVIAMLIMKFIDRNIKDEKRKSLFFWALIIVQISFVVFFAVFLPE